MVTMLQSVNWLSLKKKNSLIDESAATSDVKPQVEVDHLKLKALKCCNLERIQYFCVCSSTDTEKSFILLPLKKCYFYWARKDKFR